MSFVFQSGALKHAHFDSPSVSVILVEGNTPSSDCIIRGVATPTDPTDAVNKAYADNHPYVEISANYTVLVSDRTIGVDTTTNPITVTFPSISTLGSIKQFTTVDVSGNAYNNQITIMTSGADTVYGGTEVKINRNNQSLTLMSDGVSRWFIV